MPYPHLSDLPGYITRPCPSPPITLQQVIDAFNNADGATQETFDNLLAPGVVTLAAVKNAYDEADPTDQTNFRVDLGIGQDGTGPPGPPGPPGTIDLHAMTQAFLNGSVNDQTAFVQDIMLPWIPTDQVEIVLAQLQKEVVWNAIKTIFAECLDNLKVEINWHFETGVNAVKLQYETPCQITIVGDIYLGGAPAGGGDDVKFVTSPIYYEQCTGTTMDADVSTFDLVVPWDGTNTPNIASAFNIVLTKLDQLLRCCPPCDYDAPYKQDQIYGFGEVRFQDFLVDSITFAVTVPGDPQVNETGEPNFGRFGKFSWIQENGTHSSAIFLNYDTQIVRAPNGFCIGFAYILAPGTYLNYHMVGRNGQVEHFGLR